MLLFEDGYVVGTFISFEGALRAALKDAKEPASMNWEIELATDNETVLARWTIPAKGDDEERHYTIMTSEIQP